MKYLKTIFLSLVIFPMLIGCSTKYTIPDNAVIDANFVGSWEGKHYSEDTEHWRKWVQNRKSDGTYTIQLKYFDKNNDLLSQTTKTGYWWIQNNHYNEISPKSMATPESYRYQFTDKDTINYFSVNPNASSDEKADYTFVDKRVLD